jgi:hypothetical protein
LSRKECFCGGRILGSTAEHVKLAEERAEASGDAPVLEGAARLDVAEDHELPGGTMSIRSFLVEEYAPERRDERSSRACGQRRAGVEGRGAHDARLVR